MQIHVQQKILTITQKFKSYLLTVAKSAIFCVYSVRIMSLVLCTTCAVLFHTHAVLFRSMFIQTCTCVLFHTLALHAHVPRV